MTTRVAAGGVTWNPTPLLDVNVACYRASRVQDGQPDQVAQKLYIVPEYWLSRRTSLVFIADFERFNNAGAALDTGTPLIAGTRSSTYLAAAISHVF